MLISDYITTIKDKYKPNEIKVELTVCSHCKHPETKYCLRCEECGRKFDENGNIIKEA